MQTVQADLLVIGSGPGGYASAFRAADLGMSVVLVERYDTLGGVCLNVGCIPSKALLHVAEIVNESQHADDFGVNLGKTSVDRAKVLAHKAGIVKKLTGGLSGLAKRRKVQVIQGNATFVDATSVKVSSESAEDITVTFTQCVIAAGSSSVKLPFLPQDKRIVTSTGALELPVMSGKMLIIGGGVIGCEMATVYQAMGLQVDVVEMGAQIIPGADPDVVKPCMKIMQKRGIKFHLNTTVKSVRGEDTLEVTFSDNDTVGTNATYDLILQAVGRVPNSKALELDKAGVTCDDRGFIKVDRQTLRTSQAHIFAIGDIVGHPMLAHKATAQGRLAAEIASGKKVMYDVKTIPSVAYTDPEVAWVGLTELECEAQGIAYKKGVFPWAASGRSLCYNRTEGMTKILSCKTSGKILGASVVGRHAGDIIAELGFSVEMGAHIEDIALTVHAHPTLAETVGLAAEVVEGTITDL